MKFLLVVAALVGVASAGTLDSTLKHAVASGEVTQAIIELPPVVYDVLKSATLQSLTGEDRRSALVAALQGATAAAQAPFVAISESLGLEVEQLWGSNIILVKGLTSATLAKLAATPGEFHLREEATASIHPSTVNHGEWIGNATQNPQWGVRMIRAPEAWTVNNGGGCVAGVIDTGVNVGHTALSAGYAGAWLDPYYSTAGPTDQQGHGSHCTGSIAGRANGVGVAPGARWIACRGLNHQGSGTEANLVRCGQFMTTANPKPNVVSNSWGGGSGATWFNQVTASWRAVNIVPVFALGNSGPNCRTANSPGDQQGLIGVGSTTSTDAMSSFSSRGPVGANRKPEVSGPGSDIVSCGTGANNYVTMSGTSMATPHVAGAVCIILTQNPTWTMEQVLTRLESTAAHPTLSNNDRNCGLPGAGDFPNNAFGAGRIDVGRAVGA